MSNEYENQENALSKAVSSLKQKTAILLEKFEEKKQENKVLRKQLSEKEAIIREKENIIENKESDLKDLKKENKSLKIANGFNEGGENALYAKKQIANLVRNIDGCIKVLDSLE